MIYEVLGRPVLSENFFRLGEFPVMICVLEFERDFFVMGYSLSRRSTFDEDFARSRSRRNAKENAAKRVAEGRLATLDEVGGDG